METHDLPYRQKYPFIIDDGDQITLDEVRTFNSLWVESRKELYENNPDNVIKSYFFGTRKILTELAKDGAVGLRVYYGYDPKAKRDRLFLVAATKDWYDIPENKQGSPISSPKPCPDYCP